MKYPIALILVILWFYMMPHVKQSHAEPYAEPYKEDRFPSNERLSTSLKKRLEETGRLYFAELRLVGKSLSETGGQSVFFCAGLDHRRGDITNKRRAIAPKLKRHHTSWRHRQRPLHTDLECLIFEVLRLHNGVWVMKKGDEFIVIED